MTTCFPLNKSVYILSGLYTGCTLQLLRKKGTEACKHTLGWQAAATQSVRGQMSGREMKDHISQLTPFKASDQSRAIGELKFKKKQNKKNSVLHPGYTFCPGLTCGSSLGQHGQQDVMDRGFKQDMVLCTIVYLLFNELSGAQLPFSLSLFISF